jgi:hypothetical protein
MSVAWTRFRSATGSIGGTATEHPFFDGRTYPLARPEAQALADVLADSIDSISEIRHIYQVSGGHVKELNLNQAPEYLWTDVLERLARGGHLRALCKQLQSPGYETNLRLQEAVQNVIDAKPDSPSESDIESKDRPRGTHRCAAVLETRGGRWQLGSDEAGTGSWEKVAGGDPLTLLGDDGPSLAMSPDGSLLAAVTDRRLYVSTVTHSGTVHGWGDFDLDPRGENLDAQVRAIARKGDLEVWSAVSYGDRTRIASLSRGKPPVWREVQQVAGAEYAAFFRSELVLVAASQSSANHELRCWLVPLGRESEAVEWAPPGRDPATIRAIDAAKVGGRTYLTLLAIASRDGREPGASDLIVLSSDGTECCAERLGRAYGLVGVVRDRDGHLEQLHALIASKNEPTAIEYRLLRNPVASA